jgi:hypothetical protein
MIRWLAIALMCTGLVACTEEPIEGDDDTTPDEEPMEPGGQISGPGELEFDTTPIGESVVQTFEIRNTGVQPLLISALVVAGPNDDFTVEFDQEVSLAAESGIYLPVDVTYTPTVAAAIEAELLVLSSAFNVEPTEPFTVLLSGNATEDIDGDGYPSGADYHEPDADCDDTRIEVYPGALELCDGLDNDCNGTVDDAPDDDGDGAAQCGEYPDCDDTDPEIHPVWVDPMAIGGYGTEDEPFSSIVDALQFDHCGIILLREGTYYEGRAIEIDAGPVEIVSVDGHLDAEVSGGEVAPLFSITGGPVTFRDILFQDGYSGAQAAAIHTTADLAIESCDFNYNVSYLAGGGAIQADDAELNIADSRFLMNSGDYGGAVGVSGAASLATIERSEFLGNQADYGGAVYASGPEIDLTETYFYFNSAMFGGAFAALDLPAAGISGCEFQSNSVDGGSSAAGGAIAVLSSQDVALADCQFSENRADTGGALYLDLSSVAVSDSTFQDNEASTQGGAAHIVSSQLDIVGASFDFNRGDEGGALRATVGSTLDVATSLFLGNSSTWGGGVYADDSDVTISASLFNANRGDGAAIFADQRTLDVSQCTFFDNTTLNQSACIHASQDVDVDVSASIFFQNTLYAMWCTVSPVDWEYSNIYSSVGDTFSIACTLELVDCIELDPMFQSSSSDSNPLNDNLRLQPLSPCVDTGDPACIESDNSTCDMGAYGGTDPLG